MKAGDAAIERAAVIGAGIMGHGIAQIMAMHGVRVQVIDVTEEPLARGRAEIETNLGRMIDLGELTAAEKEALLERVSFTTDAADNLADAGFIMEAVSENFDLKRKVWSNLGDHAGPDAIIASNTSSYDINDLVKGIPGPERLLGIHWFVPPQITPCVEVIPAAQTSRATIDTVVTFLESLGKAPTLCRSAPGFVANRIQMAMVKEAAALVEEGLATPEEVDRIVKTSMGFRLGAYGPFEIIDIAGIDTYLSVFEYLYAKLGKAHFAPPAILKKQVEEGRFGVKNRKGFYEYGAGSDEEMRDERDRKLYARLRLFREEASRSQEG